MSIVGVVGYCGRFGVQRRAMERWRLLWNVVECVVLLGAMVLWNVVGAVAVYAPGPLDHCTFL